MMVVSSVAKERKKRASQEGLPIARRNSVASFLNKRNNRITARSPQQAKDVSKQDEKKTWLGRSYCNRYLNAFMIKCRMCSVTSVYDFKLSILLMTQIIIIIIMYASNNLVLLLPTPPQRATGHNSS